MPFSAPEGNGAGPLQCGHGGDQLSINADAGAAAALLKDLLAPNISVAQDTGGIFSVHSTTLSPFQPFPSLSNTSV